MIDFGSKRIGEASKDEIANGKTIEELADDMVGMTIDRSREEFLTLMEGFASHLREDLEGRGAEAVEIIGEIAKFWIGAYASTAVRVGLPAEGNA